MCYNKYLDESDACGPGHAFKKLVCSVSSCRTVDKFSTRKMCQGFPALTAEKWTLDLVKAFHKKMVLNSNCMFEPLGEIL